MQKILVFLLLLTGTARAQFSSNNKAVHFSNAADEGISIPYNNALTFGVAQSLTVEAWVKTSDHVNCMMVFAQQDCAAPGSPGIMLYISGGKAWFYCNLTYASSACPVSDNNWHHVAAVRNTITDSLYIYIDGVPQAQVSDNTTSSISTINATNWIGRRAICGSVCNYYGDIDEVRVWGKVKTGAEINAQKDMELAGNETGLIAYYNMNTAANGNGQAVINNCSNTGAALNGTNIGTGPEPSYNPAQPQSAFVPCDPVLWLKADAGVYTDAGTTNAANGQAVQQWNDQSGNGNHVTQTTAVYKPVFQSPDATAKPALYFDGVNGKSFLNNTTSNLVAAGSARTVFIVTRKDCNVHAGGVIGGALFTFRRSALMNSLSFGANSPGSVVYIYSDANGIGNNNASIAGTAMDNAVSPFILTYKIPAAGSQIQCNLNSVAQAVNQGSGSVVIETGTTGFTVGDREDIPDLDWSGWIYEVIVYARTLSNTEIANVENYLRDKYKGSSATFTALPSVQTNSNSLLDDGIWKHSYNNTDNTKLIASVRDNCLSLGSRNDIVYTDATAGSYFGNRYMRRHYVIKPTLNPAGNKRVRLYYTNADFTDLQSYVPSLISAGQLSVTKYDGTNEDGVFDPTGGTITYIPSSQITTGTLFGQNYLEFDVTGFSEFWIHTGSYALPLNFTSFTAMKKNKDVQLNWKTENENNVTAFEIERSTDAAQFNVIGTVSAKNRPHNEYVYTDALSTQSLTNPVYYYRLKQKDTDGKFQYSNIATVRFDKMIDVNISPNPVKDILTVHTAVPVKKLQLANTNGQLIKSWQPAADDHYDISNIASGVYLLRLTTDNTIQVEKIVVHK